MRLKKRSSLSLSINAIVVLVLAISMLGLGLGFTKSMFSKFGSKLDVPAPNIPATEEEPITVESETLHAKINKDFAFGLNVYNPSVNAESVTPVIGCTGGTLVGSQVYGISGADIFSSAGNINSQSFAPFKILTTVKIPSTQINLCTIRVQIGTKVYSKQITIQYS